VKTFDGAIATTDKRPARNDMVLNGRRLQHEELDNYKLGDFYLVRADNVQIQARFTAAGNLKQSSITSLKLTGSAFGGKVVTVSTEAGRGFWGRPARPIQKIWLDGAAFPPGTRAATSLTRTTVRRGQFMYTLKFVGDTTVTIMFEFKEFSNVKEGMIDLSIMMNKRKGLTGLCGDMDGDWRNDGRFDVKFRSCISARENLFGGHNPCHDLKQDECGDAKRAEGTAYCKQKHVASQTEINACVFDYCIGGREMADAGVEFNNDAAKEEEKVKLTLPKFTRPKWPFGGFR